MPKELLVVDDEPGISRALKRFFEDKGFRVATVESAQAALAQIRVTPAEIVLLDVSLPDRSGLELLSQIKRQLPNLRVVMISALTDERTIREALKRGASNYLTKPFDFTACFYAAMGIETIDVTTMEAEVEALELVPIIVAQQYRLVPLRVRDDVLELVMADPLDIQRLDELHGLIGCPIKPLAALGGNILDAIQRCYGIGAGVAKAGLPLSRQPSIASAESAERSLDQTAGVVGLINELIQRAYSNRASDLHLGIGADGPWIQERIDGTLVTMPVSPQLDALYSSIVSRLKVMANLDIAEHRLPQDGRIRFDYAGTKLDLRISVLPTIRGESLAIRLLEPSQILRLDQLGFTGDQLLQMETLLTKPTGLLLVTGPTGSGKSTSLYAFLSKLNTGRASIITIEDPIEHELPRLRQIQVQPKIGLTFGTGLRSILRHDPDIIMVGEIRDDETASLAVRAALTGHLVLSTLHTNDAASGITRLLDLGIEPFLLCSTLSGIISQRLIRLLCEQCREFSPVEAAALSSMGLPGAPSQPGLVHMWRTHGCRRCRDTGYHGRTGVFEMLAVDHRIRSLIIKRSSSAQIKQSALAQGASSLWQSGWQKMLSGVTSLEELIRILPPEIR